MNELEALAVLNSVPGLGAVKIRQLITQFGSATDALKVRPDTIAGLPGFEKIGACWSLWQRNTSWKKDLELATKHGAQLISFSSPHFPKALLNIADPPTLLYVRGSLLPNDQRSIAVVGTRSPSIYGLEMAGQISEHLSRAGFTVISGLARGIDTAAHVGALRGGRTLAVIGSGLA